MTLCHSNGHKTLVSRCWCCFSCIIMIHAHVLRWLSRAFILACLIGCLIQSFHIMQSYLLYQTSARIEYVVTDATSKPSVAFCVRYTDVLDYDGINKDLGLNVTRSDLMEDIVRTQSLFSIRQLFRYTPDAKGLISWATWRVPESALLSHCQGIECEQRVFNVTRFFLQEFMCWRFVFRDFRPVYVDMIAFALEQPYLLYTIALRGRLARDADAIRVIAHSHAPAILEQDFDDLPHSSKDFAASADRMADFVKREIRRNVFTMAFLTTTLLLQPPPYDTDCETDILKTKLSLGSCVMSATMASTGKLPFAHIIDQPLDAKHVSYADLGDRRINDAVMSAEAECAKRFRRPSCFDDFMTTTMYESGAGPELLLRMRLPSRPEVRVRFDARVSFSELVLLIGSCAGVWLGLSVSSIETAATFVCRNKCWGKARRFDG